MRSSRVNDWLQVIGLFGVIASLIFVGLQMMQDREIALSAIYQERATASTEFWMNIATDEAARFAMAKVRMGKADELTPEEAAAYQAISRAGRQLMDNSHYQYEKGFASDAHWTQIRSMLKDLLRNPYSRELVLSGHLRPTFSKTIREIENELKAERSQ